MADVRQILLLPSPEHVSFAAPIFTQADCVYANGSLPEEAAGRKDAIICGPSEPWVDAMLGHAMAANMPRVRWAYGDITKLGAEPLKALRELIGANEFKLEDEKSSAPEAATAEGSPPILAEAPPEAEPPDWHDEIPPAEEAVVRSIRTASALKKQAFVDHGEALTDWPVPADFWNATALPEFLPEYLPPAIAPYVIDQASRAGVDPAQVALNCYVSCSALIRTGIDLQMQADSGDDGRTWREKPILWGAVVGDPSTGKGPALDIALHKFYKIASVLRAKDEAAWEKYDEDIKIHEKKMQVFIAEAAKPMGNPSRPLPPQKPPRERLWTDDVTKEVVAKLLTENPRGKIAIIKDELAGWFGGFDAYGNGKSDKDRPDWLSFYESKERYIDRAMEGRSYHVPSWGGVILGGIQPDVLSRISGKLGADGMLQRFQIIVSKPKRQVPKRPADPDAVKDWNRIQENLAAMQPASRSVTLSPEAAEFMDDKAQWLATAMQSGIAPALIAALGKWEGLFGRLMLVSHCIECAAVGMHAPSPEVSLKTAEQAWAWIRWLLWPHAVHFYSGMIDQGEEFKSTKAFAEYVLARDIRTIKPHVLNSGWSHYNRNFKTIQQRREFWARVEQAGWVRPMGIFDRSASISTEYEINPAAFDGRFSEQVKSSQAAAERYRLAMHPALLARQGREPGED